MFFKEKTGLFFALFGVLVQRSFAIALIDALSQKILNLPVD